MCVIPPQVLSENSSEEFSSNPEDLVLCGTVEAQDKDVAEKEHSSSYPTGARKELDDETPVVHNW
jgi:hypothetical protein